MKIKSCFLPLDPKSLLSPALSSFGGGEGDGIVGCITLLDFNVRKWFRRIATVRRLFTGLMPGVNEIFDIGFHFSLRVFGLNEAAGVEGGEDVGGSEAEPGVGVWG